MSRDTIKAPGEHLGRRRSERPQAAPRASAPARELATPRSSELLALGKALNATAAVQDLFELTPRQKPSAPVQRLRRDGLPDDLRVGMERLSEVALHDVSVRRNSVLPGRVGAIAIARDDRIDLAPGADFALPHEAWHIVQQRQGRVKETSRIGGVPVNTDPNLEAEADRQGAAAVRLGRASPPSVGVASPSPTRSRASGPAQMMIRKPGGASAIAYYNEAELIQALNQRLALRTDAERERYLSDDAMRMDMLRLHQSTTRDDRDLTFTEAYSRICFRRPERPPPVIGSRGPPRSDLVLPSLTRTAGYSRPAMQPALTDRMVDTVADAADPSWADSLMKFDQTPLRIEQSGNAEDGNAQGGNDEDVDMVSVDHSRGLKTLGMSRNHILADGQIQNILQQAASTLADTTGRKRQRTHDGSASSNSTAPSEAPLWNDPIYRPVAQFLESLTGVGATDSDLGNFVEVVNARRRGGDDKARLFALQQLVSVGARNIRFGDAALNTRILHGFDPDLREGSWTAATSAIYFAVHGLHTAGIVSVNLAFDATQSARTRADRDGRPSVYVTSSSTEFRRRNAAPYGDPETFGQTRAPAPQLRRSVSMPDLANAQDFSNQWYRRAPPQQPVVASSSSSKAKKKRKKT